MDKVGWLVNDILTCIPGTKTFWHDLIDSLPNLIDKTNGYTDFKYLKNHIEIEWDKSSIKPEYIIRNATFFDKINIPTKTISLLQDCYDGELRIMQKNVCDSSDIVVFNSPFVKDKYSDIVKKESLIIPLGIDFDLFKKESINKEESKLLNIKEDTVLYVGSSDFKTKGFDKLLGVIESTNFNFCVVLKDDFKIKHPRVTLFNKVNHAKLIKIINCCKMIICTSNIETQHLASLEAAACGLPILTTNVGTYFNLEDGEWGIKVKNDNFDDGIKFILNNFSLFKPREYFLRKGFDKKDCMKKWNEAISSL